MSHELPLVVCALTLFAITGCAPTSSDEETEADTQSARIDVICAAYTDVFPCGGDARCEWLASLSDACGDPILCADGCFPKTECSGSDSCSDGKSCQRIEFPVYDGPTCAIGKQLCLPADGACPGNPEEPHVGEYLDLTCANHTTVENCGADSDCQWYAAFDESMHCVSGGLCEAGCFPAEECGWDAHCSEGKTCETVMFPYDVGDACAIGRRLCLPGNALCTN
jgi:hypothetical protein